MENFKVVMFSVITLLILLLGGYWAVATMEPGSTHVDKQKQKELEQANEELTKEVEKLKSELRLLQPTEEPDQIVPKEETPKPVISSKYQSLINDLQKLVDDNVFMKEKSRGTRVGTLQT
ncbi:MAG: bZIP transcription factor, partial [Patescibacteria group bacterium]